VSTRTFKQLVATPLGLDRCLFDRDPALAPDVAHGFVFDNATREYRSIFPPSGVVPMLRWGPVWTDNGIACTPRDTARFVEDQRMEEAYSRGATP
jgi:hypothetical protein